MASYEDIVETFLFSPIQLLIVGLSLLIEHLDNRFEVAMGSVVYLHLAFALEFEDLKTVEMRLLRFHNCLDSLQE